MPQVLKQRLEFDYVQGPEAPAIKAEDVWVRVDDTRKQLNLRLSEDYSLTNEFEDWTLKSTTVKNAVFNNINVLGSIRAESQITVGNLITYGNNIILNADYDGMPEEAEDVKIIVNRGGPLIPPPDVITAESSASTLTVDERYIIVVTGSANISVWKTLGVENSVSTIVPGVAFNVASGQGGTFTDTNFPGGAKIIKSDIRSGETYIVNQIDSGDTLDEWWSIVRGTPTTNRPVDYTIPGSGDDITIKEPHNYNSDVFGADTRLMKVDADNNGVDRAIKWEEGLTPDRHGKWQFTNDGRNYIDMDDPYGRPIGPDFRSAVRAEIPHREILLNSDKTDGSISIAGDTAIKVKRSSGTDTEITPGETLIVGAKYVVSVPGTDATPAEWNTVFSQADGVSTISVVPEVGSMVVTRSGQSAGFVSGVFGSTAQLTLPPDPLIRWFESGNKWEFSNDGANYKSLAGLDDIAIESGITGSLISSTVADMDNFWIEDVSASEVKRINRGEFLAGYLKPGPGEAGQSLIINTFDDIEPESSTPLEIGKTYRITHLGTGTVTATLITNWGTVGFDTSNTTIAVGDLITPSSQAEVDAYTVATFGATARVAHIDLDVRFGWPQNFRGDHIGSQSLTLNKDGGSGDFTITVQGGGRIKWDSTINKLRFSNLNTGNDSTFNDFVGLNDVESAALVSNSTTQWTNAKLPDNVLYGDKNGGTPSILTDFPDDLVARLVPDDEIGILKATANGVFSFTTLNIDDIADDLLTTAKLSDMPDATGRAPMLEFLVRETGNQNYDFRTEIPAEILTGTLDAAILPSIPEGKLAGDIPISKIDGIPDPSTVFDNNREHQILRVRDNGAGYYLGPLHMDNVDGTPTSAQRLAANSGDLLVLNEAKTEYVLSSRREGVGFPTDFHLVETDGNVDIATTGEGPIINRLNVYESGTRSGAKIRNSVGVKDDIITFYSKGSGGVIIEFPDDNTIPSQVLGRGESFTVIKIGDEWRPYASGNDKNDRYSTTSSIPVPTGGKTFSSEDVVHLNTIVNLTSLQDATLTLDPNGSAPGDSMILRNNNTLNTGPDITVQGTATEPLQGLGNVVIKPGRAVEVIRIREGTNDERWFVANGWENLEFKDLELRNLTVNNLTVTGESTGVGSDGGSAPLSQTAVGRILTLNNEATQPLTQNAVIRINRGASPIIDAELRWNQTDGYWDILNINNNTHYEILTKNSELDPTKLVNGQISSSVLGEVAILGDDLQNKNRKVPRINSQANGFDYVDIRPNLNQTATLLISRNFSFGPTNDDVYLNKETTIDIADWRNGTNYSLNDRVKSNNQIWRCTTAIANSQENPLNDTDNTNWVEETSVFNLDITVDNSFGNSNDDNAQLIFRLDGDFYCTLKNIRVTEAGGVNVREISIDKNTVVWIERQGANWELRNIYRTTGIEIVGSLPNDRQRNAASAGEVLVLKDDKTGYELSSDRLLPVSTDEGVLIRDSGGNLRFGNIPLGNIGDLAAGAITSGEFDIRRIPTLTDAKIPNLNASKINAGTFTATRIPNLPTSKITTGRFAAARLPENVLYETTASVRLAPTTIGSNNQILRANSGATEWWTPNFLTSSSNLNASNLSSGTIPSGVLSLEADDIPDISGAKITSGTVAEAVIDSALARTRDISGSLLPANGVLGQYLRGDGSWQNTPAFSGVSLTLQQNPSTRADVKYVIDRGTGYADAELVWDESDLTFKFEIPNASSGSASTTVAIPYVSETDRDEAKPGDAVVLNQDKNGYVLEDRKYKDGDLVLKQDIDFAATNRYAKTKLDLNQFHDNTWLMFTAFTQDGYYFSIDRFRVGDIKSNPAKIVDGSSTDVIKENNNTRNTGISKHTVTGEINLAEYTDGYLGIASASTFNFAPLEVYVLNLVTTEIPKLVLDEDVDVTGNNIFVKTTLDLNQFDDDIWLQFTAESSNGSFTDLGVFRVGHLRSNPTKIEDGNTRSNESQGSSRNVGVHGVSYQGDFYLTEFSDGKLGFTDAHAPAQDPMPLKAHVVPKGQDGIFPRQVLSQDIDITTRDNFVVTRLNLDKFSDDTWFQMTVYDTSGQNASLGRFRAGDIKSNPTKISETVATRPFTGNFSFTQAATNTIGHYYLGESESYYLAYTDVWADDDTDPMPLKIYTDIEPPIVKGKITKRITYDLTQNRAQVSFMYNKFVALTSSAARTLTFSDTGGEDGDRVILGNANSSRTITIAAKQIDNTSYSFTLRPKKHVSVKKISGSWYFENEWD